jgi:hypothetical protein
MAVAFELGFQKCCKAVAGDIGADDARAQAKNIGIVMLTAKPRRQVVMHQGRTNVRKAVGRDGHADTRPANQNAARGATANNGEGKFLGVIGIIHGSIGISTKIKDAVTAALKLRDKQSLHFDAAVIGGDDNGFGRHGSNPRKSAAPHMAASATWNGFEYHMSQCHASPTQGLPRQRQTP